MLPENQLGVLPASGCVLAPHPDDRSRPGERDGDRSPPDRSATRLRHRPRDARGAARELHGRRARLCPHPVGACTAGDGDGKAHHQHVPERRHRNRPRARTARAIDPHSNARQQRRHDRIHRRELKRASRAADVQLAVQRHGSTGPVLLLLHGAGANSAVWTPVVERVQATWPGRDPSCRTCAATAARRALRRTGSACTPPMSPSCSQPTIASTSRATRWAERSPSYWRAAGSGVPVAGTLACSMKTAFDPSELEEAARVCGDARAAIPDARRRGARALPPRQPA